MGIPPISSQGSRRIEADGQVWIVCSVCGRRIQKIVYGMNYQRFSTAICWRCDKGMADGKTQDELVYEAVQEELRKADEVRDEIGTGMFKARGFRKRVAEAIDQVKKSIAERRRRITEE